jgi:transposase-like protein
MSRKRQKGRKEMNRLTNEQVSKAVSEYVEGKTPIRLLAKKYGISDGKMYYILRDAGCEFSHKWRKEMSDERRAQISRTHKGKILSEEQRRRISECNSCNYNGMNGYGHIKRHNCGYIQAYAPKHPNANSDGYVMLHTVLIERVIGRYLTKDEVVHHINHIRDDNRIENLRLMNKHEHMKMHMIERYEKRRNDLSIA